MARRALPTYSYTFMGEDPDGLVASVDRQISAKTVRNADFNFLSQLQGAGMSGDVAKEVLSKCSVVKTQVLARRGSRRKKRNQIPVRV